MVFGGVVVLLWSNEIAVYTNRTCYYWKSNFKKVVYFSSPFLNFPLGSKGV